MLHIHVSTYSIQELPNGNQGLLLIIYFPQSLGKLNEKVAPFPSRLFSAHIFPPCVSIMFLDIYNPSPVPIADLEANFVNNLGNISGSMPVPKSFTLTTTSLHAYSWSSSLSH